jgi:NAD(P)H dehydrogenase (quinone)
VTTLVVVTHPCPDSFVAAAGERIVAALRTTGVDVDLIDLEGFRYDAALPFPTDHARRLAAANELVLVYPTWWSGQPAMLLSWLNGAVVHPLPGLRTVVCVATHGGSKLANAIGGESGKRVVARAFRRGCASQARFHWVAFYGGDRAKPHDRTAFLDRVERRVPRLVAAGQT